MDNMAYVIAFSELNIRELLQSGIADEQMLSLEGLVLDNIDLKAYTQGIWELFEEKYNFLKSKDAPISPTMDSFYFAQAFKTIALLPHDLRENCQHLLLEKASQSKDEKGASFINSITYYLKDESQLSLEELKDFLIKDEVANNGSWHSMKYRRINFPQFIENEYSRESDDFENKLDLFSYVCDLDNKRKAFNFSMFDENVMSIVKTISRNQEITPLVETLKKKISLDKIMDKNLSENSSWEINNSEDENTNSFKL